MPVHDSAESAAALASLAGERRDGTIVPPDPTTTNAHRELAAGHRLPAIYALRPFTAAGGLMYYGVDLNDLFRKAAVYADRILRGEEPIDLPVQTRDQSQDCEGAWPCRVATSSHARR